MTHLFTERLFTLFSQFTGRVRLSRLGGKLQRNRWNGPKTQQNFNSLWHWQWPATFLQLRRHWHQIKQYSSRSVGGTCSPATTGKAGISCQDAASLASQAKMSSQQVDQTDQKWAQRIHTRTTVVRIPQGMKSNHTRDILTPGATMHRAKLRTRMSKYIHTHSITKTNLNVKDAQGPPTGHECESKRAFAGQAHKISPFSLICFFFLKILLIQECHKSANK